MVILILKQNFLGVFISTLTFFLTVMMRKHKPKEMMRSRVVEMIRKMPV